MAIKSVNGKNVYVIDVQVPTPRTSTGQSFGNLVSDLRWDLFDKIQKDIIRSGEIEKLGYKSEYEAYIDLKKSYEDQIANLNELKAKVMTGGAGSSEYLKTLRADAKNRLDYWKASGGAAGKVETVTYPKGYEAISPFGTVKKLERGYQKTTSPIKGQAPQGPITVFGEGGISPEDAAQAGQAAQSQAQGIQNATDFIDQEIERLRLEQEGLKAPTFTGTKDYTTAARKGFATAMGTGGFGLQQRPGKVQPTFYEGEATASLDRIRADYEEKELSKIIKRKIEERNIIESRLNPYRDELDNLQNISEDLKTDADKARIAKLENIINTAQFEILKRFVDGKTGKLKITDEDIALANTNAADRMTSDFDLLGARPVSRSGFLGYLREPSLELAGRERQPREREPREREPMDMYNPPGTDRPDTFGIALPGEAEIPGPESIPRRREVIDIPGAGPYSEPGAQGALPSRGMTRDVGIRYTPSDKVLVPSTTLEGYDIPVGPSSDKNVLGAEDMIEGEIADETAASYGETPASMRAAAQREEEFRALLGEDYQQMPRPAGGRSPFGRMEPSPRAQMPIERRGGEIVPVTRRPGGLADRMALRRLGRDTAASDIGVPAPAMGSGRGNLPGNESDVGPEFGTQEYFEGYTAPSEEDIIIKRGGDLKAQPESQSKIIPTRQSRSDLYIARTIKKGIELANKPAKVERLAKTNLPEKDRSKVVPEAIAVVDKIYEINRGKPNAFKMSFDEISRAFANKPKERQQAHEYLVAKDMLEGDKTKPLA